MEQAAHSRCESGGLFHLVGVSGRR
jgi:hypothetical protein